MKILALMFNTLTCPFFETALEIILDHKEKNDETYIIKCKEDLEICKCLYNLDKEQCYRCQVRFESGIKKIDLPGKNILSLKKDKNLFKLIPKEFKNLDELKSFKYDGIEFGLAVVSTMITLLKDHQFDTIKHKDTIYKCLKSSFICYTTIQKHLEKHNFDRVYIFNGRGAEYRVIYQYCRKNNIDVFVFERGLNLNRYMLAKNSLLHELDFIQNDIENTWTEANDNEREEKGANFYINRRKRLEQGLVNFIYELTQDSLPAGYDKNKRNIAIFNSSLDEYESIDSWQNHIYKDEIDGIWKVLNEFKDNEEFHFYLRIHPIQKGIENTQSRELKKIAEYGFKNLTVIPAEQKIDSYALMDVCEKTLVYCSTMGAEACYWGRPAILAGRTSYGNTGCTYNPDTHDEVISLLLQNDLQPKPQENSYKYGYYLFHVGFPYKYYKPTGIYSGKFIDEELNAEITMKHRYKLRFYKNIDKIKKLLRFTNLFK